MAHAQAIEPQPRIVVSGASGQIGGLVVEELLDRGIRPENLILVSRTPLERYAALGASTRFGDFLQPESLDTAYEGGDRLLLISLNSNNRDPRVPARRAELHQVAIDAAVEAGVQHIVYTSFVDADNNVSPIAVAHRATEAALRESGIAWTFLRNQWYADRLVGEAARMVVDGRALVLPADPGTVYVTREDCAVVAAVALMTEGHENQVYEITGPALIRMSELASIASEISGVEIEVSVAGPADERYGMRRPPGGHFPRTSARSPASRARRHAICWRRTAGPFSRHRAGGSARGRSRPARPRPCSACCAPQRGASCPPRSGGTPPGPVCLTAAPDGWEDLSSDSF